MSLAAMVYAIHDSRAKGLAKFVQILIADYVDKETGTAGPPGPSMDTLARDGGIGKGTVHRQIERLEAIGELATEGGGAGPGHTKIYHFPRFQDQLTQRAQHAESDTSAKQRRPGRKRSGAERSKPVDNQAERSANVPLAGAHMDDPDPSSVVKAVGTPSGETGNGQGRQQPRTKQPRNPRPPDDPVVLAKAREITGRQGQAAAARYLRTVTEAWGRHQAGVALTEHLGGQIGAMPE